MREYGNTWETKFTEMWADLSLSAAQIGRSLGISQTSVGRQAIRLNLPMNTQTTRSLHGYNRHRNPNKSFSERREHYRLDWLKVRQNHRNLSPKKLTDQANFLYLWLKRNDTDWFKDKIPAQVLKGKKEEHLNWKEIDKELSEKIEMICMGILSSKEFPVRVSITEIIKRSGHKVWIEKRHRKLPKTSLMIDKYLESLEDFMIKKIKWVTEKFIEEKKIPTINQFKRRSILNNKTSEESEKIQKAIRESLIQIENAVNFS